MCGRFTLIHPDAIANHFGVQVDPVPPPRFNIAPTQPLGVICSAQKQRVFRLMLWGLIPPWAKDKQGKRLINARAETAHEKPSFRAAFKRRRCLIPATGFYEWQSQADGKQPFYFHLPDHKLFAFAGLWDVWEDIQTCTILTTVANEILQPIHTRMPVILNPAAYDLWLNLGTSGEQLRSLLRPYPAEPMQAYPVSRVVNSPTLDQPVCLEPLA